MTSPRDAIQFTRESADRIANVVRTLELTPARGTPLDYEPILTSRNRATTASASVRLCKTSSSFAKGTTATLNIWESGTPPNETQTSGATIVGVVNKYANIATGKFVSVARHGNGRFYVVAAECS